MSRNILTIDNLAKERDYITLAGKKYEVLSPEDFGILEQARLQKASSRLEKMNGDNPTDEEIEQAAEALTILVKAIVPSLPESVMKQLTDAHKMAIVQAFMNAVQEKKAQVKPE